TRMEKIIGGIERPVLAAYGASLSWFLRFRWISLVVWAACVAGTVLLFIAVPKAFLPPGDSSVVFGVFIAKEGSSPQQMKAIQDRVDTALHEDPNVITDFTMTGNGSFISSNQ